MNLLVELSSFLSSFRKIKAHEEKIVIIHTQHKVATQDQGTIQAFLQSLCKGKVKQWWVNLKQAKCDCSSNKRKVQKPLTCGPHYHLSSLSFAMLDLCQALILAAKSPIHASSPIQCIYSRIIGNWKLKEIVHINGMNFSRNLSSLLCIKVFNPKVFIPNKYVIICSHDIRMKIPFSIPPITGNREWKKVTKKQKSLYTHMT